MNDLQSEWGRAGGKSGDTDRPFILGGKSGDTDRLFILGQELRVNRHAFRLVVFLERCRLGLVRLGLDRLVKRTILKKLASISPKLDLKAETAQIDRLPQVLHATKAQYAQQKSIASYS